ncbi:MAG: Gfo/Idh/MocA family oxidoreductase [Pyrinomonadaceae bacterium]
MGSGKQIGVAIIGAGFARSTQVPGFRACEGARVVAVASAHLANAESVANDFGISYFTDDWRTVIDRADVDLISIVTPPVTHREMVLSALDTGKAVLCEKPMAMNADEAHEMSDRALETGRLALIDHELRFLNGRRAARELLHRGEIGNVLHAKLLFRSDSRADTSRAWNWWSDVRSGGGALGAIGSHVIDGFRWMLGTEIASVSCALSTHIRERTDPISGEKNSVTSDDEANLILKFADGPVTEGATGTASMSMVESGLPEHRLELFGTNGALLITERGEVSRARLGRGNWEPVETDPGALAPGLRDGGWSRGFTAFAREIITALQEGRTEVEGAATFEDGYQTQLVLDAAVRANETGCRVDL